MPRLEINDDGWSGVMEAYHLKGCADVAGFLGVRTETVEKFVVKRKPPSGRFVAACLSAIPARFDDLFKVVPKR